jgi:ketosteroid isomerase-like protein
MSSTLPSALSAEDLTHLRSIAEEHWTGAIVARDWDRTLEMCAADVVYMPPDSPALQGREALRQWLEQFSRIQKFTQPIETIHGSGDVAMMRGTFEITVDAGGQAIINTGKILALVHKDSSGTWLVKSVCFNWDRPLAGG